MIETQYLVLLRGINVGGNNIIKMADLKACFENMGFGDVVTYIQSGNVLFKTPEKDKAKLTTKIEDVLSERFSYKSRLVVVTHKELQRAVEEAPKGFGDDLNKYRCDVIFLKEPLTVKEAMKNVRVKEGVDSRLCRQNCPLLFPSDKQGIPKLFNEDHHASHVSKHDHP